VLRWAGAESERIEMLREVHRAFSRTSGAGASPGRAADALRRLQLSWLAKYRSGGTLRWAGLMFLSAG